MDKEQVHYLAFERRYNMAETKKFHEMKEKMIKSVPKENTVCGKREIKLKPHPIK
jgi:hypothetical protein